MLRNASIGYQPVEMHFRYSSRTRPYNLSVHPIASFTAFQRVKSFPTTLMIGSARAFFARGTVSSEAESLIDPLTGVFRAVPMFLSKTSRAGQEGVLLRTVDADGALNTSMT